MGIICNFSDNLGTIDNNLKKISSKTIVFVINIFMNYEMICRKIFHKKLLINQFQKTGNDEMSK